MRIDELQHRSLLARLVGVDGRSRKTLAQFQKSALHRTMRHIMPHVDGLQFVKIGAPFCGNGGFIPQIVLIQALDE